MRQFTKDEVEEYLEYFNENVIPLQEVLGKCFICGVSFDRVKLPEGLEKQVVCLKDRNQLIELFESYGNEENEPKFEPELLKKMIQV